MIRTLTLTPDGRLVRDLPQEEWPAILQEPNHVLWVDFERTPPEHDEPLLRTIFHFHPLAIDDALQESHIPKIDDWGAFLYIVMHSVSFQPRNDAGEDSYVDTQEIDIFLGKNFVVTHHDEPIPALERVWSSVQRDERHMKSGADHLLYRLTDEIVASYMPVVEELDDEIDRTEDEVFGSPTPRTLERIFDLKRSILHLRRIIAPQREVLNKLARDDYEVIDAADRVYFRDVYDHLVRLYDITESVRDLIGGALDTYLSVINNRMNDIMKTLTIITTLFMPISFVASFFGMNFFQPVIDLSAWTGRPAFYVTMALIVGAPFAMFYWMRRRGWM